VTDPSPLRPALKTTVPPLLLSFGLTVACHLTVGPTLALFFAGVVVATLLVPPLSLTRGDFLGQLLVVAGVLDGIALGWLIATADPLVTFADCLRAYGLLLGYGLALWGLTALLARAGVAPVLAPAVVVVVAMLWLAWPVWLSPWLAGRDTLVGWLTWPHPLLALDGALRHLGPPWTERHWMYTRLTVLNQDVFYELPRGVWPGALLHGAVGAALLLLAHARRRVTPAPAPPPSPATQARAAGGP
jgi:hypothetical protein